MQPSVRKLLSRYVCVCVCGYINACVCQIHDALLLICCAGHPEGVSGLKGQKGEPGFLGPQGPTGQQHNVLQSNGPVLFLYSVSCRMITTHSTHLCLITLISFCFTG